LLSTRIRLIVTDCCIVKSLSLFYLKTTWEKVALLLLSPHRRSWPPVHGSLARAGKVKGQTPKVEKQEKKKTPKGRAKKRNLYNRLSVPSPLVPAIHLTFP
jgi:small subunit ribosomal protein S30e